MFARCFFKNTNASTIVHFCLPELLYLFLNFQPNICNIHNLLSISLLNIVQINILSILVLHFYKGFFFPVIWWLKLSVSVLHWCILAWVCETWSICLHFGCSGACAACLTPLCFCLPNFHFCNDSLQSMNIRVHVRSTIPCR